MGGFFGAISHKNCIYDVFFGTDYHSHLGTRRAGLAFYDTEKGFQRQIHSIENTPFRTKFDDDMAKFSGNAGIGCISDTDPQPLLVRSHLGMFAISTVGIINNAEQLVAETFSGPGHQFMAMSSGKINTTELTAALINQRGSLIDGIRYAQEVIDGSCTILLLTPDAIIAARDRLGRLPVLVGKNNDGLCVSFESFAYHKLGYQDHYELGPGEIVKMTADGLTQLAAPGTKMKICAFLWTYYGYPNSNYEGKNVEVMRYRNGEIMVRKEMEAGTMPDVDFVAGVPDSGLPHAIGYANQSHKPFARPFVKYTPTWPRSFTPCQSGDAQSGGEDEADSRARADSGQEAAVRGRLHRPGHPAAGDGGLPVRKRREGSAYALRLSAHHVRLQISEFLPLQLRNGADRPTDGSESGGRRGAEALRRVRRRHHPAGQMYAQSHLRGNGLRFPGLPVSGRPAGGHRTGQRQGLHLLLERQRIIKINFRKRSIIMEHNNSQSASYAAAGVDITAGYKAVELMKTHIARTRNLGCLDDVGGFGGCFGLPIAGMEEPVLVSGTDGCGTKVKLAILMDKHDTIGIDAVAMCVNDIICVGAKPLFFLDYIACGKNVPEKIAEIVGGVAEGCVQSGAALIGGETAEHPGLMPVEDYDLAGFAVGIVDKKKILRQDENGGRGRGHRAGFLRHSLQRLQPDPQGFPH